MNIFANVLMSHGRQARRPRHHLSADDPGGGLRHARLRAHRRHSLRGVRRLLAGLACRPHHRLQVEARDHRRRGLARRQEGHAQAQRRRGADQIARRREGARDQADRRAMCHACRPRSLVRRARRQGRRRLPAGGDGRGGSAVHSLHLGLDGTAEGRAAHFRRLSRLCLDDASIRVRLSRRRHLLVHGRCRLGHRPFLYRLRTARQRRDHADVRRRAELSRRTRASGRWSTSTTSTSSTPRRPRSGR